ncbi:MAG: hypothetical protein RL287_85 [Actinomycetota bacterium]
MFLLPHHDGSELYVSRRLPRLGERVNLRVRVPLGFTFQDALVRFYRDGEPRYLPLRKVASTSREEWWQVSLELTNRVTKYRFLFAGDEVFFWLTAAGLFDHEVHSNVDFQLVANDSAPSWLPSAVFYQIFPDRFAKSSERDLPRWAVKRNWNELPRDKSKYTGIEVYGGDFQGVSARLDHIISLGANGIYFTPFFPANSNHRYDATTFDCVDPLLGGDDAWFQLVKKAKRERIHLVGDITTNHVGAEHEWFKKALRDKRSVERNFFFWDKSFSWGYVGWWNLPSLPKLNFASKRLRLKFYESSKSVIRKWLSPKYGLSGWRVDVSNMTGRYRDQDVHDEVMHGIRKALDESHRDAWLVAENGDFEASDLDGRGWHGTMNYQGFFRPLAAWMNSSARLSGGFQGLPIEAPHFTGIQFMKSVSQFNSSIPWQALISSMTLIDSHDTPRFRTIVDGDRCKHLSAMTLLLSYPGVPSIFMGDEIGLEGKSGEDSRRTIDWENRANWDTDFLDQVKSLVHLRRTRSGLSNGGLRWIDAGKDYVAFLRESKRESLLVFISSGRVELDLDLDQYGYRITETLFGPAQDGTKLRIRCSTATQGIWVLGSN